MLIRATNWQLPFLYQLHRLQNRNFWFTFFSRPCTRLLFTWKWITLTLFFYDMRQMAFWVLGVRFFQQVRFLGGPFFLRSSVRLQVRVYYWIRTFLFLCFSQDKWNGISLHLALSNFRKTIHSLYQNCCVNYPLSFLDYLRKCRVCCHLSSYSWRSLKPKEKYHLKRC